MKQLFGFALVGIALCALSCEDDPKNPGDFSLKAELSLDPMVVTSVGGQSYVIEEEAVFDTAYMSSYVRTDTTFETDASGAFVLDAAGKKVPLIGDDGKLVTTNDTIVFPTGRHGMFHRMKMIKLDPKADTFTIHVKSNAMWLAPQYAPTKAQWFFNYNLRTGGNSLTGGGDSYFYFRTIRNKNKTRVEPVPQYIYTSDSTVMYQLNFVQAGERD